MIRKFWQWFKGVLKQLADPLAVLIFVILWLIVSGALFIGIGFIAGNYWLIGVGTTIAAFWTAPFTPLIPLIVITSVTVTKPARRWLRDLYAQRALIKRMGVDKKRQQVLLIILLCLTTTQGAREVRYVHAEDAVKTCDNRAYHHHI